MAFKPKKGKINGTKKNDKIIWSNSEPWKKRLIVNAGSGRDIIDFIR